MVDRQGVELVFKRIRPLFIEHKGDFQIIEITDEGVVKVRLIGQECQLCAFKEQTRLALETMLMNEVPSVKKVKVEIL
jgi:Fe-S cluster biogenesis protein NfuA